MRGLAESFQLAEGADVGIAEVVREHDDEVGRTLRGGRVREPRQDGGRHRQEHQDDGHPSIPDGRHRGSIRGMKANALFVAALTVASVVAIDSRGRVPPAPRQGAPAVARAAVRPNVLWISNEDMSPHLGVYGDTLARTPTLDRLAAQSVRFTSAFTTAPVCAPSRAAIITGMYQAAIGAHHMRTTEDRVPELPGPYLAVPPFYVKAFPEYLRAAGYHTANRVKTDYQFGTRSRSGTISDRTRTGGTVATSRSRSSRCSIWR